MHEAKVIRRLSQTAREMFLKRFPRGHDVGVAYRRAARERSLEALDPERQTRVYVDRETGAAFVCVVERPHDGAACGAAGREAVVLLAVSCRHVAGMAAAVGSDTRQNKGRKNPGVVRHSRRFGNWRRTKGRGRADDE